MNQHTLDQLEKSFKDIMTNEHNLSEGYYIVVPTTNNWEYDLPAQLIEKDLMRIDISNWTKDQSHLDNSGIYLTTAFDEDENSKFFNFKEIVAIFTKEGQEIFTKKYYQLQQPEPEVKQSYTMQDIMHKDTEGLKHSRSKLKLATQKKKDK